MKYLYKTLTFPAENPRNTKCFITIPKVFRNAAKPEKLNYKLNSKGNKLASNGI